MRLNWWEYWTQPLARNDQWLVEKLPLCPFWADSRATRPDGNIDLIIVWKTATWRECFFNPRCLHRLRSSIGTENHRADRTDVNAIKMSCFCKAKTFELKSIKDCPQHRVVQGRQIASGCCTCFHDVMATELAEERRRQSCLASYCVSDASSRPPPSGSCCCDMTELFRGESGEVFAKWRTVCPVHECTCPPRMFLLQGKVL